MLINHIHKETYWHTVCSIQYIHTIIWAGQHLVRSYVLKTTPRLSPPKSLMVSGYQVQPFTLMHKSCTTSHLCRIWDAFFYFNIHRVVQEVIMV